MLSNNRTLRLVLFAAPALALAVGALFLVFGPGSGERARAGSAVSFSLGVDFDGNGTNDCGTGAPSAVGDGAPDTVSADVSNTTCAAPAAATLQVNLYLMNAGGTAYSGQAGQVFYDGVTSNGRGTTLWTCHTFDVTAPANPAYENAGSAIGVAAPCNVPQTSLGLMNRFAFTCSAGGTLRLGHGTGETELTDDQFGGHNETGAGDSLTVTCGGGGGPTATPMPVTATPVPVTATPTGPTNTPGPTATTGPTNTPTNTVPATATRTRTPMPVIRRCDVDGDGDITSVDAHWILQKEAGFIQNVPLPENADCYNADRRVNSIDAEVMLQIDAGLAAAP